MEDSPATPKQRRPLKESRPLQPVGPGARPDEYRHAEAFKLMIYRSDDGRLVETLWNSRDGVVPFIILSCPLEDPSLSVPMQHVHWGADTFAPWHVPNIGSRIFVDMTHEIAAPMIERRIERDWQHPEWPMSVHFESKDEARESMLKEALREGAPAVVTVDAAMQRAFYENIAETERVLMQAAIARKARIEQLTERVAADLKASRTGDGDGLVDGKGRFA